MKKREELQKQFEKETGEKHWTNPVCHGEVGYASWKYQSWLEEKVIGIENEIRLAKSEAYQKIIAEKIDIRDRNSLELNWEEDARYTYPRRSDMLDEYLANCISELEKEKV